MPPSPTRRKRDGARSSGPVLGREEVAAEDRRDTQNTKVIGGHPLAVKPLRVVLAGLLFRAYRTLVDADPGYRRDGILRMAIFPSELDVDRLDLLPDFYERLRASVLAEPGVTGITLMAPALPPSVGWAVYLHHPAFPEDIRHTGLRGELHAVDSAFFPVLGIRILAGRNIRPGDGADQEAAALVSRTLAERMGPGERRGRRRGAARPRGRPWGGCLRSVGLCRRRRHHPPRHRRRERASRRSRRPGAAGAGAPRRMTPPRTGLLGA